MTEFLVFTICAPIASWGDIAVGETRGSWDRPSRSAILGLVAGALGVTREDQNGHDELDRSVSIAVRLDRAGESAVDYHTAQTVSAQIIRKRGLATRAELMSIPREERETILSRRAYRQSVVATIAIWLKSESRFALQEIARALRSPHFVPFAGRKANVLGLPLHPTLISGETLADAFVQREAATLGHPLQRYRPRTGWGREIAHDPCEQFESGLESFRRDIRRDANPHRGRWQFADRLVDVGFLPASASSTGMSTGANE